MWWTRGQEVRWPRPQWVRAMVIMTKSDATTCKKQHKTKEKKRKEKTTRGKEMQITK